MALTFSVKGIDDKYTTAPFLIEGKEQWHPIINALASMSMICGFNKITEKNYKDVWRRIAQYEMVTGDTILQFAREYLPDGANTSITEDDVRKLIGWVCNATPKTDAQWRKTLLRLLDEAVDRRQRLIEHYNNGSLFETFEVYMKNVVAEPVAAEREFSEPWKFLEQQPEIA